MLPRRFRATCVESNPRDESDDDDEDWDNAISFQSSERNPSILFVNQESRNLALKTYESFIVDNAVPRYFSVELDTLALEGMDFWLDGELINGLDAAQKKILNTVKFLTIGDVYFERYISEELLRDMATTRSATRWRREEAWDEMASRVLLHFGKLDTLILVAGESCGSLIKPEGEQMMRQLIKKFSVHMNGRHLGFKTPEVVLDISHQVVPEN